MKITKSRDFLLCVQQEAGSSKKKLEKKKFKQVTSLRLIKPYLNKHLLGRLQPTSKPYATVVKTLVVKTLTSKPYATP
jgi:hypothetical protein